MKRIVNSLCSLVFIGCIAATAPQPVMADGELDRLFEQQSTERKIALLCSTFWLTTRDIAATQMGSKIFEDTGQNFTSQRLNHAVKLAEAFLYVATLMDNPNLVRNRLVRDMRSFERVVEQKTQDSLSTFEERSAQGVEQAQEWAMLMIRSASECAKQMPNKVLTDAENLLRGEGVVASLSRRR